MSLIWREQLSLGNEILDNDHKHLLELINQAEQAMRSAEKRAQLAEILEELHDYTRLHFNREEKFMQNLNYPKLHEHQQLHVQLVATLKEITGKLSSGSDEIITEMAADDMAHLLRNWLVDHIIKEDLKFKPYLKKGA